MVGGVLADKSTTADGWLPGHWEVPLCLPVTCKRCRKLAGILRNAAADSQGLVVGERFGAWRGLGKGWALSMKKKRIFHLKWRVF